MRGGDAGGRRWNPAPALKASAALHVGGAVAALAVPAAWPEIVAALAANHLLLLGAGFAPRSRLLGPNLVRLPASAAARREVALTFDDGPDPSTTGTVLDLLDAYGAKASFFCVGERAAAHADLAREIARRGHGVENHSQRHSTRFGWYGPRRLRDEIESAQATLGRLSGAAPAFFRAPFGIRSPFLDPVLAGCGLRLVSWTRRGYDAVDDDPDRVLGRLCDGLGAGDILVLHDSVATGGRANRRVVLEVLPRLLDRLAAARLVPVPLQAAWRP
jgi:peptidoglycan/xylan/chitin deacetylase (PgdA/CDA1 family)